MSVITPARLRALLLDAWPLLLAVVLVAPLYGGRGYPIARDLVFLPRHAWTPAVLGLDDAPPRAVPLDAVLAALTAVVDGGILARAVLPLVLAAAGWGVHRLLRDCGTAARLAAGGFAVWNPYVVERLTLGQWALLLGYAALPWIAAAAIRWRRDGDRRDLATVVLWTALASLTPTGGLLAVVTAAGFAWSRGRRVVRMVALLAVLQLPWLVPALTGSGMDAADPAGVDAFAAHGDTPGGFVVSVLGLGGIWDTRSVPASRETWLGVLTAVVVVAVVALAVPRLARLWGRGDLVRGAAIAAGGLAIALLSATPWGSEAMRWLVVEVPGAGLLRDAQKFLAPACILVAAALGVVTELLLERVRRHGAEVAISAALPLLALPVLLLPDATSRTWTTVGPVSFPEGLEQASAELSSSEDDTAVATLPWRSYRHFTWANGEVSSDPAIRWFDRTVLTSAELAVGNRVIRGESRRTTELGRALERGRPAEVLPEYGVGWVLVYRDDPDTDALDLSGLSLVVDDPDVRLYKVPGDDIESREQPTRRVVLVVLGDLAALAVLCAGALSRIRRANSTRR
ncbi:hypothetical protein [Nocardioides speluncae]|uniref:hypothetical protein n=1 Tax=Nocardioides speluncae TaxID=2670337 RepID=UPI0012B16E81|nr:hypothetical protein [Nocardioides speluncae]